MPVAPATETCFSAGGCSRRIDFFVVSRNAKNLLRDIEVLKVEAPRAPLRTPESSLYPHRSEGACW